jgi:hypothetical protein
MRYNELFSALSSAVAADAMEMAACNNNHNHITRNNNGSFHDPPVVRVVKTLPSVLVFSSIY